MSAKTIVLIFSLFIYILILISFNKARKKYSGGKIGELIKVILVMVIFLFVADYIYMFEQFLSQNVAFILETVFKTLAIAFLAYGGAKIAGG